MPLGLHRFFFYFLLLIGSGIIPVRGYAQIKKTGIPFVKNYRSGDYNFHPRNFCGIQDQRGIVFVGNSNGVMEFDGISWRKIFLPKMLAPLAMAMDSNGKVYVGSSDEVGFLESDSMGLFAYKSLLNLVPKGQRNFGEVRKIIARGNEVFICSYSKILLYKNNQLQVVDSLSGSTSQFIAIAECNGKLFINNPLSGLYLYEDSRLRFLNGGEFYKDKKVIGVFSYLTKSYIILTDIGFFIYDGETSKPLHSNLNNFILENSPTSAFAIGNDFIAVGTYKNGIVFIDKMGNVIQHINKTNGLPDNTIHDLFTDSNGNLWAPSDKGVSYAQINSPFTFINEQFGLDGMGYCSMIFKGKIYLGTTQGVYVNDWDTQSYSFPFSSRFKLIEGTEGRVSCLNIFNDVLICGHKKGTFQLEGEHATLLSKELFSGGWTHRLLSNEYLVAGMFSGLELFKFENGRWNYYCHLKGFDESARLLEVDDDKNIWVCHGNRGLFRVRVDIEKQVVLTAENYCTKQRFSPEFFSDVATIDGKVYFASEKGLYQYDRKRDGLVKADIVPPYSLDQTFINKIFSLNDSTICVIDSDNVKLFRRGKDGNYLKDEFTGKGLKDKLIESYEYIKGHDPNNIFVGIQDGFIHYDPTVGLKTLPSFQVLLRKVETISKNDSIIYAGNVKGAEKENYKGMIPKVLPYALNSIRISFAAPFYSDNHPAEYQVKLLKVGSDADTSWTPWTNTTFKEYIHLEEGEYIFCVRARNLYDVVSKESVYRFEILPPWYRTFWAYIGYGILVILCLMLVVKLVRERIKKEEIRIKNEEKKLREEKEKELILKEKIFKEEKLLAENQIMHLKNQQLENDMNYKNQELAVLATSLSHKTEFLNQLKKDLDGISKGTPDKTAFNQLLKSIEQTSDFDSSWDQFQINFDQAHNGFLGKLRANYPSLKPADLLLCAYIKLSKTSKEIATLMNVSLAAVEKRRYRLREKMSIDNDKTLIEFILNLP